MIVTFYYCKKDDNTSSTPGVAQIVTNGTWSWGWDDSSAKFHISIGSSKPLSDLTGYWLILEKTEILISLKNDNSAKNEQVTFARN